MASPDEELEAVKLIVEYQHYFAKKLEERKRDRKDDIISDIVHARLDGERPLDTAESLSIIQQLLVAGNETTTSAIAEGILLLIQHPDQLALLQNDPGLIPNLVEEVLRLSTPTANMWRVCKKDTEVNGTRIPAGSMIQIRYSSADRDERVFEHAEAFDVTRKNARQNVAFGYGVHMCIGASLARKEMEVAFRVLLEPLERHRARLCRERSFLSAECAAARARDATDQVRVAALIQLGEGDRAELDLFVVQQVIQHHAGRKYTHDLLAVDPSGCAHDFHVVCFTEGAGDIRLVLKFECSSEQKPIIHT